MTTPNINDIPPRQAQSSDDPTTRALWGIFLSGRGGSGIFSRFLQGVALVSPSGSDNATYGGRIGTTKAYRTVQAAVTALAVAVAASRPALAAYIGPGTYTEQVTIPQTLPTLTLKGMALGSTTITSSNTLAGGTVRFTPTANTLQSLFLESLTIVKTGNVATDSALELNGVGATSALATGLVMTDVILNSGNTSLSLDATRVVSVAGNRVLFAGPHRLREVGGGTFQNCNFAGDGAIRWDAAQPIPGGGSNPINYLSCNSNNTVAVTAQGKFVADMGTTLGVSLVATSTATDAAVIRHRGFVNGATVSIDVGVAAVGVPTLDFQGASFAGNLTFTGATAVDRAVNLRGCNFIEGAVLAVSGGATRFAFDARGSNLNCALATGIVASVSSIRRDSQSFSYTMVAASDALTLGTTAGVTTVPPWPTGAGNRPRVVVSGATNAGLDAFDDIPAGSMTADNVLTVLAEAAAVVTVTLFDAAN